jgi:hypothetical protein
MKLLHLLKTRKSVILNMVLRFKLGFNGTGPLQLQAAGLTLLNI